MSREFLERLSITNLLILKNDIDKAILKKEPNDVFSQIKKMEVQKTNVKSNLEFDSIQSDIDYLNSLFS